MTSCTTTKYIPEVVFTHESTQTHIEYKVISMILIAVIILSFSKSSSFGKTKLFFGFGLGRIIIVYIYKRGIHFILVSTTFLTRKNSHIFLVLLTEFEPQVFGSRVGRSTNWATSSPLNCQSTCIEICFFFPSHSSYHNQCVEKLVV